MTLRIKILLLLSLFRLPIATADALPEPPLNADSHIALTHQGHWLQPVAPNIGSSADGRVGLNRNYGTLYLVRPETLSQPAMNPAGPAGISILSPQSWSLPAAQLFQSGSRRERDDNSNAVCDPPQRQNPHPCAEDSAQDCYDLTIIHSAKYVDTAGSNHVHLWGTDIRVAVKNPKTPQAEMSSVKALTGSVSGPDLENVSDVFEPSITQDGRLLVVSLGQQGGRLFTWKNNATGKTVSATYNIMYAYNSTRAACDVAGWDHDFAPVTHAHWDPELRGETDFKVKFAQEVLRDPEGNPLPDGVDLGGVYPWIDRSGANLFFSQVEQNLFYLRDGTIGTQYEVAGCAPGAECVLPSKMSLDPKSPNYYSNFDERRNTRGLTVAGLWTHGKEVLIDANLNNTDYGIYGPDNLHYEVQLYAGAPTEIGTGRDAEGPPSNWQGSKLSPPPKFYTRNTTIVDSFANLFNYHGLTMKPNSVRDVAWIVNMGKASSTISFDDWIDPDALIIADMNASLSFPEETSINALPVATYHNGFAFNHATNEQGGLNGDLHLQNAATGTKWNSPPFGTLTAGRLRIEPVALGGKTGKGLWLDGNSGFQFELPPQKIPLSSVPWFVSLWWDSRSSDQRERRLFTFPDRSVVSIRGNELSFHRADSERTAGPPLHTTRLPGFADKQWTHIALAIDARLGVVNVKVFLNGYRVDAWQTSVPALVLTEGSMQVGAIPGVAGVRGWVDDFKVLAHIPDPETICNHAGGTLMGVDPGVQPWSETAAAYPQASHAEVTQLLSTTGYPTYQSYVCYSDSRGETGTDINTATEPSFGSSTGLHSLRAAIHFPEGPLVYDRPRPDSTHNQFCLSCHQPAQNQTALSPAALVFDSSVVMSNDPRRQPFQPPALIFGNIPRNLFSKFPQQNEQAPAAGLKVDAIVFPEP